MAYYATLERHGLGESSSSFLDGSDGLCCDSCREGYSCEQHGLGQVPGLFNPPDAPVAASSIAQDILDLGTSFVSSDSSGQGIINAIATGANFVPGVGPLASSLVTTGNTLFRALGGWLHLGAGRKEADLITGPPNHVQDVVMNHVKQISYKGLSSNSVPELQNLVQELRQLRSLWMTFLGSTEFHDGRASAQALNTVMPYIDGTCGYTWPPPFSPSQTSGCGGAWPDDFGYGAGLLGALERGIIDRGGAIPAMTPTQYAGTSTYGLYSSIPGSALVPQSGTLPSVAPLSGWKSAGISSGGLGQSALLPLLIGAGILYLL